MNFANIRNNEIIDFNSKYLDSDIERVNVDEEIYQAWLEDKNKVVYQDGEIVLNPNYEAEQEQKEKERIAQLNMTRGDFIEGLILALGKDESDVIALIETLPITDVEKKVYINRVKNALDFYRGYPVINVLCGYLGLTTEQMDLFFETRDYKHLIPIVEEPEIEEPVEEENADSTDIQE